MYCLGRKVLSTVSEKHQLHRMHHKLLHYAPGGMNKDLQNNTSNRLQSPIDHTNSELKKITENGHGILM